MKCPKCGGNALLSNWGSYIDPDYADFHVECEKCGYHSMGSTDPQKAKEMFEKEIGMCYTNEQWLRLATTEQLANIFFEYRYVNATPRQKLWMSANEKCIKTDIVEWLKQPHT